MPNLTEHPSGQVVKLLNIGESGAGKTGALASLAAAGYNLHILDYDSGLDILRNVLTPEAAKRVRYETLRDQIVFTNGVPKLKPPVHAYKDAGKTLTAWDADKFGPNDVLVLDSLTTFSDAAFNEALMLAGRLNQRPQLQDYGWLADSVKLFIEMITSDMIPCNVVVNTHIRFFAGDAEEMTTARGLPNAKGQEISRIVSRYFNTVVLSRSFGSGPATKRVISTQPQGVVEVKTSQPSVKPTYPITTGLAELFKDILGHEPGPPVPHGTQP